MSLERIESLLRNAIGLDPESIGRGAIQRAVADRQRRCGIAEVDAYWDHLAVSPVERQQLIDSVIVPETWFFRDPEAFAALRSLALARHTTQPDALVRVLSLPCASGEEAYSLAMALMDAGVPVDRFRVDGVDVSQQQLDRARAGIYGKSSFRGSDLSFRDRFFTRDGTRYRVVDSVRAQVDFHHGSLLATDLTLPVEAFDIIWCRNLLIYFDRPTQDAAIQALTRLLAADGLLFVGSSEAGALAPHAYDSVRMPMAFAFRKQLPQPVPNRLSNRSDAELRRVSSPMARVQRLAPTAPVMVRSFPTAPPAPPDPEPANDLRRAEQLADAGRFEEAAACCEGHIRRHGPSADALYLQALVYDASGRAAEAEPIYRKALYLNPQHREALVHLGLLLDRANRPADANVLKQRLRRLQGEA